MGAGKVIGIILLILILIVGVVGVDLYLTYSAIEEADVSTLVSDPTYTISDDNSTVSISITVDLPTAGFIPKGVNLDITADFDGEAQTQSTTVNFGDSKTITLDFTLTDAHAQTLAQGGSLTVGATALVTPAVFGFAISQIAQTVDLGSQTISV